SGSASPLQYKSESLLNSAKNFAAAGWASPAAEGSRLAIVKQRKSQRSLLRSAPPLHGARFSQSASDTSTSRAQANVASALRSDTRGEFVSKRSARRSPRPRHLPVLAVPRCAGLHLGQCRQLDG